jgi:2-polyprenyl-3-methyl-5-hydroxy-6-metoxy-1,4-benzoquinol methylase
MPFLLGGTLSNDNNAISNCMRINEQAWNRRASIHLDSSFYDVNAFMCGKSTLKSLELGLCGEVSGLDMLHLQCHFGLDSLSWARRGANVTGVDFSSTAIAAARRLASEARVSAKFIQSDVLDLPASLERSYDLVISTYGVLNWLPCLDRWARGIARSLRSGGRFILVEFHPILDVLFQGSISGAADYFNCSPSVCRTRGTYAVPTDPHEATDVRWAHPLGSVINALTSAGLNICSLVEYPFCSYRIEQCLDAERDGYWWWSKAPNRAPFMFSIVAEVLSK